MMGSSADIVWRLLSALGVGLLIGIERGWYGRSESEGDRVAGIRTFSLVGLLGGVLASITPIAGEWVLVFTLLGLISLLIASYYFEVRFKHNSDVGITTEISLILTFILGMWAAYGYQLVALGVAVAVMAILSLKTVLHGWLQKMEAETVYAGIKLLVISVILLPLLPNEGYGPWESLNPYWIWWMVVLISGISFMGYLLMLYTGQNKGTLLASVIGGLVSSTAVTISLAERSKKRKTAINHIFMAGVLLASSVMFIRVLMVVAVVNISLMSSLWIPMLFMFLVTSFGIFWFWSKANQPNQAPEDSDFSLGNPLQLPTALKFGLILALVLVLASALEDWFGERGIYLLAVLSGLMDVDAITISLSRMALTEITPSVAGMGIIIAVISNTLFKATLFMFIAGLKKSKELLWVILLVAAGGILVTLFFG